MMKKNNMLTYKKQLVIEMLSFYRLSSMSEVTIAKRLLLLFPSCKSIFSFKSKNSSPKNEVYEDNSRLKKKKNQTKISENKKLATKYKFYFKEIYCQNIAYLETVCNCKPFSHKCGHVCILQLIR